LATKIANPYFEEQTNIKIAGEIGPVQTETNNCGVFVGFLIFTKLLELDITFTSTDMFISDYFICFIFLKFLH